MKTTREMKLHLLSRAAQDMDFRTRLMEDPRQVVADEFGVDIPDLFSLAVHEESSVSFHLVLPPSPMLSEDELELIGGGSLGDYPADDYIQTRRSDTSS